MIIAGSKIYERCPLCRKLVRLTGLFGGWHLCLSPEEREVARMREAQIAMSAAPRWLL
jgi:hypothetical protein